MLTTELNVAQMSRCIAIIDNRAGFVCHNRVDFYHNQFDFEHSQVVFFLTNSILRTSKWNSGGFRAARLPAWAGNMCSGAAKSQLNFCVKQ